MHMHGFTILLRYGLGPFVCSEQIVYTCFLIIIRHCYTFACILCYLPAHSRIHYLFIMSYLPRSTPSVCNTVLPDRSLENLVHRLLYYLVRIALLVEETYH